MIYSTLVVETLAFTSDLAKNAGKLLLEYYQPGGIHTSVKKDHTALTDADLASDDFIHGNIQDNFSGDVILSEENGTTYPEGKSAVWVVDPLDGTTNFSLGLHYWGVSIARLIDGEPDTAALYFPVLDEMFTAQRGTGAFFNGRYRT